MTPSTILLPALITFVIFYEVSSTRRAYTAAAFDHARFGTFSDPPGLVVKTNLKIYKKAAEVASSKGADIIVYPEYGILFPANRTQFLDFYEDCPDPKKIRTNPCEEREMYAQRPILHTLSCLAKNNSIVIVANTADLKNCTGQSDCPDDGVFHYNTNVVFDKDGTLLLRYYKEHLFYEAAMDSPKEQQDPTFETDFGTFATFICFDIIFKRMGLVAKWPKVDGIMFSTMWADSTPQYTSVPLWQGWSMGNNATLVVSNINIPGYHGVGSGIFHGLNGALGYTFDPDGISKLVIAKVPVSGEPVRSSKSSITAITATKSWDWESRGAEVPKICSKKLLNLAKDYRTEYRCFEENTLNYTLVKLIKPSGYAEACNNGMCCSVQYSAEDIPEDFYLGVYNGSYTYYGKYYWCEESCFLARCDSIDNKPCTNFPRISNTVFHYVKLQSNFSTKFIYPSVVSSSVRLVPADEWNYGVIHKSSYESSIDFHSKAGKALITVGFKARCYERDPPFVRYTTFTGT